MTNIRHFRDLVNQLAMAAAMKLFEASKKFPLEEKYSLTDQMRRSSRSVCADIFLSPSHPLRVPASEGPGLEVHIG
jgi:hypothetical protein